MIVDREKNCDCWCKLECCYCELLKEEDAKEEITLS